MTTAPHSLLMIPLFLAIMHIMAVAFSMESTGTPPLIIPPFLAIMHITAAASTTTTTAPPSQSPIPPSLRILQLSTAAPFLVMGTSPSPIPPSRAILFRKPIPERLILIITLHKLMILFTVLMVVGFTLIVEQLPFPIPPSLETLLHSPTPETLL